MTKIKSHTKDPKCLSIKLSRHGGPGDRDMCISKLTTEDEKLVEVIKQVSHYMSENADCDRQTDRPVNSVH